MINKLSIRKLRLLGCAYWRLIFPYLNNVSDFSLSKWTTYSNQIEDYAGDSAKLGYLSLERVKELKYQPVHRLDLSLALMTNNRQLIIHALSSFSEITVEHKMIQTKLIRDVLGEGIIYSNCSLCNGTGSVHVPDPAYKISMIPQTQSCRGCEGTGQFDLSFMYNNLLSHHLIKSLAQQAYNDLPKTDGLLILSDALEEVQAPSNLLNHLRTNEPHIKGCSVLDLILGNN